jgi:hypothetical protein
MLNTQKEKGKPKIIKNINSNEEEGRRCNVKKGILCNKIKDRNEMKDVMLKRASSATNSRS